MSEDKSSGNDEVGYGRPPKEHQFKKGASGNPSGRPKSKIGGNADISGLLDEPVKARIDGKTRNITSFEASTRLLAKKAIDGDLQAIIKFLKLCEGYDVIAVPPLAGGGGVIQAPPGVDFHEWIESVTEEVPLDEA